MTAIDLEAEKPIAGGPIMAELSAAAEDAGLSLRIRGGVDRLPVDDVDKLPVLIGSVRRVAAGTEVQPHIPPLKPIHRACWRWRLRFRRHSPVGSLGGACRQNDRKGLNQEQQL